MRQILTQVVGVIAPVFRVAYAELARLVRAPALDPIPADNRASRRSVRRDGRHRAPEIDRGEILYFAGLVADPGLVRERRLADRARAEAT